MCVLKSATPSRCFFAGAKQVREFKIDTQNTATDNLFYETSNMVQYSEPGHAGGACNTEPRAAYEDYNNNLKPKNNNNKKLECAFRCIQVHPIR